MSGPSAEAVALTRRIVAEWVDWQRDEKRTVAAWSEQPGGLPERIALALDAFADAQMAGLRDVVQAAQRVNDTANALCVVRGWSWGYDDIHVPLAGLQRALGDMERTAQPSAKSKSSEGGAALPEGRPPHEHDLGAGVERPADADTGGER